MTNKQIIIDDQRKTIHRLQDECTEKTNAIIALGEQIKAKEQECAMLRKMFADIDSANVKLHNKIDQLKAELEEYKNVVNKLSGMQVILTNEEKMPMLYENAKDLKLKQLSKTLTEIEEYLKPYICRGGVEPQWVE